MVEFHVGEKEGYGIKQRTNNLFCASVEKCMILIQPTDFIVQTLLFRHVHSLYVYRPHT